MTQMTNQQISNIVDDLKNNNRLLENDINNLNNNIHEKEHIAYVLKNYRELTKKYKILGITSSIVCIIVLSLSIYVLCDFVNASILGICSLELGALTLSVLSGVQYALDNDYTKIKKEYNLEEIENDLEILKENVIAKNNALNNNNDMINTFLKETQEDNLKLIQERVMSNNKILVEMYKKLEKLEMLESDLNREEMKHQNKIAELNKLQIKKNDVITQIDDLANEIEILKDQINTDEEHLNINNRYSSSMSIEEEINNILNEPNNKKGIKLERRRDK